MDRDKRHLPKPKLQPRTEEKSKAPYFIGFVVFISAVAGLFIWAADIKF